MYNNIGISTDNIDVKLIHEIKDFFYQNRDSDNIFSFVIFSNKPYNYNIKDTAILPKFYQKYFKGYVVYMSIEDLVSRKHYDIGTPILYLKSSVDATLIQNTIVLYQDPDQSFRIINYHELQQFI